MNKTKFKNISQNYKINQATSDSDGDNVAGLDNLHNTYITEINYNGYVFVKPAS